MKRNIQQKKIKNEPRVCKVESCHSSKKHDLLCCQSSKRFFDALSTRVHTAAWFGIALFGILFLLPDFFAYFLGGLLIFILCAEWPRLFVNTYKELWWIAWWYPVVPFALLIQLSLDQVMKLPIAMLFLVVFAYDSGAYFVGSRWGKTLLFPSISPNKTGEGFLGGCISSAIAFAVIITMFFDKNVLCDFSVLQKSIFFIGIPLLISCASLLGDLFESWLKRRASLKDTGTILPGHGGLLDRFDSILFVTILLYFFRAKISFLLKVVH